jgi:tRNA 2-thiocytidine biosynthesis protein TtcA
MKNLLQTLEKDIPHIRNSMLKALSNVHPRHLLDSRLWRDDIMPGDG